MNIKHLQSPYKQVFLSADEILSQLELMEKDATIDTGSPRTFREKHMDYLKGHPKVNPEHYLSNLRTVLRIRA